MAADRKMKFTKSERPKNFVSTSGVTLPYKCQLRRMREGAVQITFVKVSLPI